MPTEIAECIEVHGGLAEAEFRHIVETLLGRPRQRHKAWATHYVFDVTTKQADELTAYLRTLGTGYDRETTVKWRPQEGELIMPITPATHPERFTDEEAAIFKAGLCCWVTEYGTINGVVHCRKPSESGADFGYCAEHAEELAEDRANWR